MIKRLFSHKRKEQAIDTHSMDKSQKNQKHYNDPDLFGSVVEQQPAQRALKSQGFNFRLKAHN